MKIFFFKGDALHEDDQTQNKKNFKLLLKRRDFSNSLLPDMAFYFYIFGDLEYMK